MEKMSKEKKVIRIMTTRTPQLNETISLENSSRHLYNDFIPIDDNSYSFSIKSTPETLKRTRQIPLTSTPLFKLPKKMVSTKSVNVNNIPNRRDSEANFKKEIEDYDKMFQSGAFSDIKLVVENQELKAHKNVLAARSQYFSDLLNQQDSLKSIEVNGIDFETLKIVIRYIYCAKLEDFSFESAKKVFTAAKKFVLPRLTEKSKKVIINKMTVDNIYDLASFSQTMGEEDIKDRIIDFIKNNITKFKEADLMKFNSEILAKVIGKIIDCHALN